MKTPTTYEPKPKWIMSVLDLPTDRSPARYRFTDLAGETREVTLEKRKKQVVDALIGGPLFCASTVRIGDIVFRLKEDHGLYAATKALASGRKYYALSGVTRITPATTATSGGVA